MATVEEAEDPPVEVVAARVAVRATWTITGAGLESASRSTPSNSMSEGTTTAGARASAATAASETVASPATGVAETVFSGLADAVVAGSVLVDEVAAALEANEPAAPRVLAKVRALADAVRGARVTESV